jgi:hypothetical protein
MLNRVVWTRAADPRAARSDARRYQETGLVSSSSKGDTGRLFGSI